MRERTTATSPVLCLLLIFVFASIGRPVLADCMSPSLMGENIGVAEFGNVPGVLWQDYAYPNSGEISYAALKNMGIVRIPVLWERMQPTLFGPLSVPDTNAVAALVNQASSLGVCVLLDIHNYGAAVVAGTYYSIGADQLPETSFYDLWEKLGALFPDKTKVAFDLMNEPANLSLSGWEGIAQRTVNVMRSAGITNRIFVEGGIWAGAGGWFSNDGTGVSNATAFADFSDPANNFVIEAHEYEDPDSSGTYQASPPVCVTASALQAVVGNLSTWAQANHKTLFLGETGVPNDPACLAAMDGLLSSIKTNDDVWVGWTYWAAGPWWGGYALSIEPSNGVDAPQMAVLSKYFTPANSCGTNASGTTYTLQLSQSTGSTTATTDQCPNGGSQPTQTTVSQTYLCTNGTQTAQGNRQTVTTSVGEPLCNAPAACGSYASGTSYSGVVSTTPGTMSASSASCPNGGSQPTQTTVSQTYLCTNGVVTAQGAPTTTTVKNGTPTCATVTSNDTVELKLSEDAYQGDTQFVALLDGIAISPVETITVHQPTGNAQTFDFKGNWGPGNHVIGIKFVNDNWDGTSSADGHDRNIFVHSIAYDGLVRPEHDYELFSNGTFSFPIAPLTLTLQLSEDSYQGDVMFIAYMDGVALGGAQAITVHQPTGQSQAFNYTGYWASGTHTVTIEFFNDDWDGTSSADGHDRNIFVNGIQLGTLNVPENKVLFSNGKYDFSLGQ